MSTTTHSTAPALSRPNALKFIILLGVVSLFGDMTYEGARGIAGPYLALLGASGTVVGIMAGLGELFGYALRLVSGYVSDRTGRYWAVTIIGYIVNLFAVPLLAFAGRLDAAVLLMVAERAGRAIRTPARDAMLSHAAGHTGLGWGFGLHEALDQTGAVIGPLAVGALLARHAGYRASFAALVVPALLSLTVLLIARALYPHPRDFDLKPAALSRSGMPHTLWLYIAAVACVAAGYVDFPLIAFHLRKYNIISDAGIPVLYAVAMGVDGFAALLLGRLFDRIGIWAMVLATMASALAAPFAFLGGSLSAVVAVVLWGTGMGAQESVMRAAIAALAPSSRRATAYGLMNAAYGLAWFAGSVVLGVLYDVSIPFLAIVSVLLQGAALPIFLSVTKTINLSAQQ